MAFMPAGKGRFLRVKEKITAKSPTRRGRVPQTSSTTMETETLPGRGENENKGSTAISKIANLPAAEVLGARSLSKVENLLNSCPSGTSFYTCANGFEGCCSANPCESGSCPSPSDQSITASQTTGARSTTTVVVMDTRISLITSNGTPSPDLTQSSTSPHITTSTIKSKSSQSSAPERTSSVPMITSNYETHRSQGAVIVEGVIIGILAILLLLFLGLCLRQRHKNKVLKGRAQKKLTISSPLDTSTKSNDVRGPHGSSMEQNNLSKLGAGLKSHFSSSSSIKPTFRRHLAPRNDLKGFKRPCPSFGRVCEPRNSNTRRSSSGPFFNRAYPDASPGTCYTGSSGTPGRDTLTRDIVQMLDGPQSLPSSRVISDSSSKYSVPYQNSREQPYASREVHVADGDSPTLGTSQLSDAFQTLNLNNHKHPPKPGYF